MHLRQQPLPEWCSARLPSVYSYIQGRYWDVGLLRFYRDPRRVSHASGLGLRSATGAGGLAHVLACLA